MTPECDTSEPQAAVSLRPVLTVLRLSPDNREGVRGWVTAVAPHAASPLPPLRQQPPNALQLATGGPGRKGVWLEALW